MTETEVKPRSCRRRLILVKLERQRPNSDLQRQAYSQLSAQRSGFRAALPLSIITPECSLMHTIFQEGTAGAWFDIANNEHIPCGTSKRVYLENGGLHVADSGQDVTITFAISRKKLVGLGLALIFAACPDLRGILFKALGRGRSPQPGQGRVDDVNDITVVETPHLLLQR
jgi:hypothetical protein